MIRQKRSRKAKDGYTGSMSIQQLGHRPADPRRRLQEETRNYLGMVERWATEAGAPAHLVTAVRAACGALLGWLGR